MTTSGAYTATLSIRSGQGSCSHDRVFRFIPLFRTSAAALRYAIERKQDEAEREQLIRELQNALTQVKTLSGLLPICSGCKKIRDDQGYWNRIETYISEHSGAQFSHGICPDCAKKYFPDYTASLDWDKLRSNPGDQGPDRPRGNRIRLS